MMVRLLQSSRNTEKYILINFFNQLKHLLLHLYIGGSIRGSSCHGRTGACQCKSEAFGVGGFHCDSCLSGFWKFDASVGRFVWVVVENGCKDDGCEGWL